MREKAKLDQIAKDNGAKEKATKEQAAREQAAKELADKEAREKALRDTAIKQESHAVVAIIDRFNAAYKHHKLKELKQVWPKPRDLYRASIEDGRLITLQPTGQFELNRDTASIDCDLITTRPVPVRVLLQKNENGWLIVDVTHR